MSGSTTSTVGGEGHSDVFVSISIDEVAGNGGRDSPDADEGCETSEEDRDLHAE